MRGARRRSRPPPRPTREPANRNAWRPERAQRRVLTDAHVRAKDLPCRPSRRGAPQGARPSDPTLSASRCRRRGPKPPEPLNLSKIRVLTRAPPNRVARGGGTALQPLGEL